MAGYTVSKLIKLVHTCNTITFVSLPSFKKVNKKLLYVTCLAQSRHPINSNQNAQTLGALGAVLGGPFLNRVADCQSMAYGQIRRARELHSK